MTKIKNSCVLITGGASGIGRIMGRIALEKGARCLVIWDINEVNINATIDEFKTFGKVKGYKVDVSDYTAVSEAYALTKNECGNIDILINNAGIVTSNKTFDRLKTSEIERTMNINATAPMLVASQMLPEMIERNHGHICNIASAGGMLSNPKMSVYAASKWAVIGWSDSVRIELKQAKSKVRFTTIAPYFINTGMFDGVQSRIFPILKPEPTAKKIIKAIEKNRNFKGIPFGYHFIRFCQAILPTSIFDFIFGEVVGIFHAMDNFTGRK
ncbi:MAG: SDR family oxidoreductase [Bacteroidaceae bacterium]|nr:SDR family oxidoreductase [Bacteroidaceae bacterium]MBQ8270556.1 SDR family oxidoreductase [Bacteroidaceae bacterium]